MKKDTSIPDWMNGEDARAEKLVNTGKEVNNPSARKSKKEEKIERSVKGFYIQTSYQITFEQLVSDVKHQSGKKAPELIEEALSDLFKKYGKKMVKL